MRNSHPRSRRGATLIELLVALVLLDLALLSLVALSAVAARGIGDAGRLSRSAVAATNRLERLSSVPCSMVGSGSVALEAGVTEIWTSAAVPGGVELSDSIVGALGHGAAMVLRTRRPC